MVEYQRPQHRAVARILDRLDARVLSAAKCYFGGGTRIALELNEYRVSEDVDFICSDIAGYRALRAGIDSRTFGRLLPEMHPDLSLLRDVRADQYGIRTIIDVQGEPVKFEIILEARIEVAAMKVRGIPVPVLDRTSCFAEKWLANADRWTDKATLSRDAIDLAFMLSAWSIDEALAGAQLANSAYGDAIGRAARGASAKLLEDGTYQRQCAKDLDITDAKRLLAGLRVLEKVAKDLT
jgi:Nucleotidyl transferase AbiEii toxin, Type IV TA system